jgi:hypothetical protein
VLEQGFDDVGPDQALAPSAGFAYRIDRRAPSAAASPRSCWMANRSILLRSTA